MKPIKVISIEELWRFFNLSESLFCILGKDGYYSHVNPSFAHLLGFPEDEFTSKPFIDFVHPEDRTDTLGKLEEIQKGKIVTHFVNRYRMIDGNSRWISWMAILPDKHGDIYSVGQDCNEKVLLQDQLVEERLTKERSVMQATLYGQELEKSELGKELHDNINQMLGAAKLYLEVSLTDEEDTRTYIEKARDIVVDAIEEIRELTRSLVGPNIREISLVESIHDLIDTVLHKKGMTIDLKMKGISEDMPPNLKLMLFRIVQEQLTNILKHADARKVTITIELVNESVRLRIFDDGVGFNVKSKKNGIGLNNIRSRTQMYNGQLEIKSSPGKGCRLTVVVPWPLESH